jgi:3-methylcrotonyl-CoA carboxylase beta subunit
MGAQQAAHVLVTLKQQQQQRQRGNKPLAAGEERRLAEPILKQYEIEESPYFATARLWDDGILDPMDTRRVIGQCLDVVTIPPLTSSHHPVFRM